MPKYAEVVFDIPVHRGFHYGIPLGLQPLIDIGKRIRAPFGKQQKVGWCVGFVSQPEIPNVKDIAEIVDIQPLVNDKIFALAKWISEYYFCSLGEALNAVVPPGVKQNRKEKTITLIEPTNAGDASGLSSRHLEVLQMLGVTTHLTEFTKRTGATYSIINTLAKKGFLNIKKVKAGIDVLVNAIKEKPKEFILTKAQEEALAKFDKMTADGKFPAMLLWGITGSGKTEVYLCAIEKVVREGKQAIVLVPEISLTPQTVGRFKARFDRIAVLHSYLTEGERSTQWQRIRNGEVDIVIGARSAIFAPTKNLGLVVIDEEHENTYKQENVPRYHTRDAVLKRAELEAALVIMGTATPSLEAYHYAKKGDFNLVILPERIEKFPLPAIEIVDMAEEMAKTKYYPIISRRLKELIAQSVGRKEQVILFLNRRGFATYTSCKRCGWVFRCARCDVAMNYHKLENRAVCHYCSRSEELPAKCPECGIGQIKQLGIGTQRIEEEIRSAYSDFRIARMDSDAMQTSAEYSKTLGGLWSGEVDVLIGTQMIAKGLDVPNVTLVGVISADTAFNIPDFRSAERTFQLITQVAGRAGRGPKGGQVVVQTFNPTHYSIVCAAKHDYEGFAEKELAMRKEHGYPPFTHLIRLVLVGKKEDTVRNVSNELYAKLKKAFEDKTAEVLIAPAPIYRVKGRYRMQILIKAFDFQKVREDLRKILSTNHPASSIQLTIDIDPISMM